MEGYVTIRGTFTAARVWMVLDGQYLTYYDRFDVKQQQPRGLKGFLMVKDASVTKLSRQVLPNGVKVKTLKEKVVFSCSDENAWSYWFSALSKASKQHEKESEHEGKIDRYKSLLEIGPNQVLSKPLISRAYKRLSLKAHPDKGGDPGVFQAIREAYNALLAIQVDADELANSYVIHYEATIEKRPGVGLGVAVSEDSVRRQLIVQSIHKDTKIHFLSEESEGEIRPGDALIGIDQDDCSRWPMLRVKARLDAVRLPFGTKVILTFERRVPRDAMFSSSFSSPIREVSSPPAATSQAEREPSTDSHRSSSPPPPPPPNDLPREAVEEPLKSRGDNQRDRSVKEEAMQSSSPAHVLPNQRDGVNSIPSLTVPDIHLELEEEEDQGKEEPCHTGRVEEASPIVIIPDSPPSEGHAEYQQSLQEEIKSPCEEEFNDSQSLGGSGSGELRGMSPYDKEDNPRLFLNNSNTNSNANNYNAAAAAAAANLVGRDGNNGTNDLITQLQFVLYNKDQEIGRLQQMNDFLLQQLKTIHEAHDRLQEKYQSKVNNINSLRTNFRELQAKTTSMQELLESLGAGDADV
eukprot:scaffold1044_cov186-Ochromonas_danica.AAC.1